MNERRPEPGHPPLSYELHGDQAIFYRRVSDQELAAIRALGRFTPPSSGIPQGKHLTTTANLARAWGRKMVEIGWEVSVGSVLRVRVAAPRAEAVHFVGAVTDGIGACYFATLEELDGADISEVSYEESVGC